MLRSEKKPKPITIGNYVIRATIGKGNSAVVKLATHTVTKQKVAIKMIDRTTLDTEKSIRLKREIDSMKIFSHPNVIQLYEIMETSKLICLVTEYASNGELYEYITKNKRLSEREARYFFKQIVAAVHYCHKSGIVHRDIKVENLLLDSELRIKLADFGFSSTFHEDELLNVWCGSPPYCAPELYLAQLYNGPKVDIWSLGVVLYVLLCKRLPFDAGKYNELRKQVIKGAFNMPFYLSEDCKSLINGMLTVDPTQRFTMNDIINHPWFRVDNDPDDLEEFRCLLDQIEHISIKDNTNFIPDERVLAEIRQLGIDSNLVIDSLNNKNFDENEGIYHLIQSRIKNLNSQYTYNDSLSKYLSGLPAAPCNNRLSLDDDDTTSNPNSDISSIHINRQNHINLYNINKNGDIVIDDQDDQQQQQQQLHDFHVLLNQSHKNSISSTATTTNDDVDYGEDDDIMDDGEEELAKQYLERYSGVRRHTIGTNLDNNYQKTNINKSTENLTNLFHLKLNGSTIESTNELNGSTAAHPFIQQCLLTKPNDLENYLNKLPLSFRQPQYTRQTPIINQHLQEQQQQQHRSQQQQQSLFNHVVEKNFLHESQKHNCDNNNNNESSFSNNNLNKIPVAPVSYGRRASDGGCNISLFNHLAFSNSNFGSTAGSRGSITSGIPVKTTSPSVNVVDSSNSNNNDDDEKTLNSYLKTKKPRTRHEPYLDSEFLANRYQRQRETSFSGAAGSYSQADRFKNHRSSEPNHLDILLANRVHFEALYNQALNGHTTQSIQNESQSDNSAWQRPKYNMNTIPNPTPRQPSFCFLCSPVDSSQICFNKIPMQNILPTKFNQLPNMNNAHHRRRGIQIINQCDQQQNDINNNDLITNAIAVSVPSQASIDNTQTTNATTTTSATTSVLQMIQEEQHDSISISSTPRLSSASTISNFSIEYVDEDGGNSTNSNGISNSNCTINNDDQLSNDSGKFKSPIESMYTTSSSGSSGLLQQQQQQHPLQHYTTSSPSCTTIFNQNFNLYQQSLMKLASPPTTTP